MSQITKTHSKIGIASCVIGIAMFPLFLIATIAYYFQFKQGTGASSADMQLIQLLTEMVLPIPVHIFGFILGAISIFFPNRKKLFPGLGMILNLVFGLCSLFPWLWLVIGGVGKF